MWMAFKHGWHMLTSNVTHECRPQWCVMDAGQLSWCPLLSLNSDRQEWHWKPSSVVVYVPRLVCAKAPVTIFLIDRTQSQINVFV